MKYLTNLARGWVLLFGGFLLWAGGEAALRMIAGGNSDGEREGEVKFDDCREKIWHAERPLRYIFSPFTCVYQRNLESIVVGGTCVRIEYASGTSECRVADLYPRKSKLICPQGTWASPTASTCVK